MITLRVRCKWSVAIKQSIQTDIGNWIDPQTDRTLRMQADGVSHLRFM